MLGAGYDKFKMLTWVMIPGLWMLHLAALIACIYAPSTGSTGFVAYFTAPITFEAHGTASTSGGTNNLRSRLNPYGLRLFLLSKQLRLMLLLSVCAVSLMLLNALTQTMFDHGGCNDPLLRCGH